MIGAVVGDAFFRQGKPGIGALMAVVFGLVVLISVGAAGTRATRSWHTSTRR